MWNEGTCEISNKELVCSTLSSEPMCFGDIVKKSGLNRAVVSLVLKELVASGKVVGKPALACGNSGRPQVFYSFSKSASVSNEKATSPTKPQKRAGFIVVDFMKLKVACRYEKGGNCKKKLKKCSPSICLLC